MVSLLVMVDTGSLCVCQKDSTIVNTCCDCSGGRRIETAGSVEARIDGQPVEPFIPRFSHPHGVPAMAVVRAQRVPRAVVFAHLPTLPLMR
jgi:hypothetical protein